MCLKMHAILVAFASKWMLWCMFLSFCYLQKVLEWGALKSVPNNLSGCDLVDRPTAEPSQEEQLRKWSLGLFDRATFGRNKGTTKRLWLRRVEKCKLLISRSRNLWSNWVSTNWEVSTWLRVGPKTCRSTEHTLWFNQSPWIAQTMKGY